MRKLLLLACGLLGIAAPLAAQQAPSLALAVHNAVSAACGNCIVGVTIGSTDDRSSWTLQFAPGATASQQSQAATALAAFDLGGFDALQAALTAGTIQIACAVGASVCTSAIAGTYRADAAAQATVAGIASGIAAADRLPGGGTSFNYPDSSGIPHVFTAPQFLAFAAAVEDFVYSLSQGTAPTQPISLQ